MHRIGSKYSNVLPAVYNDALSYDEQLSKLCYKVNEIIGYLNKGNDGNILPTNEDGSINWGKKGDFAISNGVNSLEWIALQNGSEVRY